MNWCGFLSAAYPSSAAMPMPVTANPADNIFAGVPAAESTAVPICKQIKSPPAIGTDAGSAAMREC